MGRYREQFEKEGEVLNDPHNEIKEPRMYLVVLLNDHYTSMDFVMFILETVFSKGQADAQRIMLAVHQQGSGIAGVYTKEVAETKIAIVHQLAAQHEFPLKCTMEPESSV